MGLGRALARLDDAVIPSRWLNPDPDPVRQAARSIYSGAVFLAIGLVLALAFNIYAGLVVGAGSMIVGAVRLSAALRARNEQITER
jgi:hypothetical protein